MPIPEEEFEIIGFGFILTMDFWNKVNIKIVLVNMLIVIYKVSSVLEL